MQGWDHIENIGESLKVYRKGDLRRLVDKEGRVIAEFKMGMS